MSEKCQLYRYLKTDDISDFPIFPVFPQTDSHIFTK